MVFEFLTKAKTSLNSYYTGYEPWQIVASTLVTVLVLRFAQQFLNTVRAKGLKGALYCMVLGFLKRVPIVSGKISQENEKVLQKMEKSVLGKVDQGVRRTTLPEDPVPQKEIFSTLDEWRQREEQLWKTGRVSGCVYHGGDDLQAIISRAYEMFAVSNPLHPDVFPYVRKMEAEVVQMTVDLYRGTQDACGTMTSGGTESILLACKAYRDQGRDKGICDPEIIVPSSAHAAFAKAASYFGIKLVIVPVDQKTFRADVKATAKAITRNTVALVGSAPSFPQGVIDPITELGALAGKYKIGLHVDCCLGSFLLPFLRELGYKVRIFDFRIPEVTSISADPHKYGFTPKGSSVILYSNKDLRHYQYFVSTDWSGGIYASPNIAGSRPGGLIAATWATMLTIGRSGYLESAREIMKATKEIENGIRAIPGLTILGQPDMSIVCFTSNEVDVYKVGEALNNLGWNLNTLQFPRSIHICVTRLHINTAKTLLDDIRKAMKDVKDHPELYKDGSAAIYGLAETVPDRGLIGTLIKGFVDTLYKV